MKRFFIVLAILAISVSVMAQSWVNMGSATQEPAKIKLISSNITTSVFKINLRGFSLNSVTTPQGNSVIPALGNTGYIQQAGAPDLPVASASLIIPDLGNMTISIVSSNYTDFPNVDIAPSKGNLLRTIDPASVPYTYGAVYSQNSFYPGNLVSLNDPYILRDFRGQAAMIYPFQYNPVTKVLRVYSEIVVKMESAGGLSGTNTFNRTKQITAIDTEFKNVYDSHFLNYKQNPKYTALGEHGKMLVVCYDAFMSDMQPFVDWKNDEGVPTEMVSVTTAGGTATNIKTYVTNYYNTNGLTFLLLVGDAAQLPTFTVAGGGSDPTYGYLVGNDHFQEIFVGRFSAENAAQVTTQVNRSISYELTPTMTPGKFNHCTAIGSDQGPGDNNEYDYQHQQVILAKLMNYTYTAETALFDGTQASPDAAGNPTPAMVTADVNAGTGIITYTGHGADNAWGTTGFANTDVTSLTNTSMWPFILSVACVNGNFTAGTCFAEAWMRYTYNGLPAGAVATFMSSINQSWNPPMASQDESVSILTEAYTNNIKRTYGGICVNGNLKMNDLYSDYNMTDTWHIFGDPSLMVRTANPMSMTVTHSPQINLGETSLAVNCNVEGALVCLTIHHQIIGTAYVVGGIANITFPAQMNPDTILVTATAFNYVPYQGDVYIIAATFPNDAQTAQIIEPASVYSCSGLSVLPTVVLRNLGTTALTNCTLYCNYDGVITSQSWSGNLAQYATDTVIFQAITLTTGAHLIKTYTSLPNGVSDDNTNNDSLQRSITVNNAVVSAGFTADITSTCQAPASVQFTNTSANALSYSWDFGDGSTGTDANPAHDYLTLGTYTVVLTASAGVCGDDTETLIDYITVGAEPPVTSDTSFCVSGIAVLNASGNGSLTWYDAATGGNILTTGTTYTTPTLTSTTTYYVENSVVSAPAYVGNPDTNSNGTMFNNNSTYGEIFDCYTPLTLVSVLVNAQTTASRTITLVNSGGTTLQTATVNIPAGMSRVTLNFAIPADTGLQLLCSTYPNMYRNTTNLAYPYVLPGYISINRSNAGGGNAYLRYYYFYDWELQTPNCVSARIPAIVNVSSNTPSAAFISNITGHTATFTDQSTNAASWLWYFGDGNTSTLQNPAHTYATDGAYTIKEVVYNGCGADSITQNIEINTAGIKHNASSQNISIYPNPANGQVYVSVTSSDNAVEILLYDVTGKQVFARAETGVSLDGATTHVLDVSRLRNGLYFMVIRTGETVMTKKLVIAGK
ncbi:MAG: C25 family cysteine peptidase [Bacteroidota bacterium]